MAVVGHRSPENFIPRGRPSSRQYTSQKDASSMDEFSDIKISRRDLLIASALSATAMAMPPSAAGASAAVPGGANKLIAAFAPTGKLRASINLGNPILAGKDASGAPRGVSVDLARELASRLGLELELLVVDTAGKSVDAVAAGNADIGFFAIDPKRGAQIAFTPPYVLIEGFYLVKDDSPIRRNAEVDAPGTRVVVGAGSAYDLYLTRELKHAEILRSPSSPKVVDTFIETRAEVAAGVKQQLEVDSRRIGGLRLLDQRFMVIRQAMGVPKNRGAEASAYLAQFVEDMKASGFVAAALERRGIDGAEVAPAGNPMQDPLK
ncbi:bacterial extracellular solute-binding s, 3 family protein [Collimonas fungivorans]|uniref:Bacterial extracellular solute-binding s, 3 family protein n=2 Tax=Collimonas fungivorans TaxID=158899 RepID=A0A127PE88_9BURK|nr:bacterial extracellular solute-binding s, 3 family protein [Collimonas fungivorans]